MSAMILCSGRRVRNPYYVEDLGIHLYSGEELSYYIYHNAMLIGEDFFDERLFRFIGTELRMAKLEEKLRRWSAKAELSELLLVILQDIRYYNSSELDEFKREMESIRSMTVGEKMKAKGDYLLKNRRYTAAGLQYDRLISGGYSEMMSRTFRAKVWLANGIVYARQFCWQQAAECLECSWESDPQDQTKKLLYFVTLSDPEVQIKEETREGMREDVSEETVQMWTAEYEQAKAGAVTMGKGLETAEWMNRDNIRRAAGLRKLTDAWKEEYRRNQGG